MKSPRSIAGGVVFNWWNKPNKLPAKSLPANREIISQLIEARKEIRDLRALKLKLENQNRQLRMALDKAVNAMNRESQLINLSVIEECNKALIDTITH